MKLRIDYTNLQKLARPGYTSWLHVRMDTKDGECVFVGKLRARHLPRLTAMMFAISRDGDGNE